MAGQAAPLPAGWRVMARLRVCWPTAQAAEQGDQAPQGPASQSALAAAMVKLTPGSTVSLLPTSDICGTATTSVSEEEGE